MKRLAWRFLHGDELGKQQCLCEKPHRDREPKEVDFIHQEKKGWKRGQAYGSQAVKGEGLEEG